MHELLDSGVLMKTIQDLVKKEPKQLAVINVLTYGTGNIKHILFERVKPEENETQPHILLIDKQDGRETPRIENRYDLLSLQNSEAERFDYMVKRFKEEHGRLPNSLEEILQNEQIKAMYPDGLPESPLGGEFYLDSDGTVKVRNLKYLMISTTISQKRPVSNRAFFL